MVEVLEGKMNGEELTFECTAIFFGCIEFPAEKNKRVWCTIDDLVEDGVHCDITGIRGEEEG